MPTEAPLVLDSVTHLGAEAAGRAALCASHGGVYAAWYAAHRGVSAVILHDAGIGRERAGLGTSLGTKPRQGCPRTDQLFLDARVAQSWRHARRGSRSGSS